LFWYFSFFTSASSIINFGGSIHYSLQNEAGQKVAR
jgi:hypothetical protein